MPNQLCLGCLIDITKKAIILSTEDDDIRKSLLDKLSEKTKKDFDTLKLPDYSTDIFSIISKETGVIDPFLEIKERSNKAFLKITNDILKSLKGLDTKTKLKHYLLYSICANMVDFSTGGHTVDIDNIAEQLLDFPKEKLAIDNFEILLNYIENSKRIIYLSDNCGEVVVDNLVVQFLVKDLMKEVYLGLKGGPIANDCTLDDFKRDNLPEFATETFIVSSSFGYNLNSTTDRFKELLENADLLIVKGQSNYETTLNNLLRHQKYNFPPIFSILRTKCNVITKHLGVPLGSNVIKRMNPLSKLEFDNLTEIVDCK